jgi:hypothetical protein
MVDATCSCPVHSNCKHCAAVLLQVQETLDYPAAAKDAELLEKLQAVLENRSPKAPPQVLVDNVQPVPRLWLASIEFSAFEPRNGGCSATSSIARRCLSAIWTNTSAGRKTPTS